MKQQGSLRKHKCQRLAAAILFGLVAINFALPPTEAAEPSVRVTGYEFTGEIPVAESELQAVLAAHRGKEAKLKDLEAQAAEITHYLRSKGYFVAQAYVPPQEFKTGHIQIKVMPGRYGKVTLNNKTKAHDSVIRKELGNVKDGALIYKDDLERGIWLVGDLATRTEAKTTLKAGEKPGTTDLTVNVSPKGSRLWGYVGFDNGGYHYTGRYQYSVFASYANPFRQGDLLTISGVRSNTGRSMWSGSAAYVTPVFSQGNTFGISYAKSHYLLGGPFESMGYTGSANIWSFWLEHNFQRSRNANWYGQIRFDVKSMNDGSDSISYAYDDPKHSHNWVIGIHGDTLDTWKGGGANTYAFTYTHGNLSLEDDLTRLYDDYTAQTHGYFSKYNFTITRLQKVRDRLSLYLSYTRQWAEKNLDPSEKLCLGGPYGVRAYPVGEASGDDGWLGTAELRWNLPSKEGDKNIWQLITFVDSGSVRLYHDTWAGYTGTNNRSLSGMGVGVNWSYEGNWAARLHYAWKLGSEDALSDTDRSGRLWFQLYRFF